MSRLFRTTLSRAVFLALAFFAFGAQASGWSQETKSAVLSKCHDAYAGADRVDRMCPCMVDQAEQELTDAEAREGFLQPEATKSDEKAKAVWGKALRACYAKVFADTLSI